MTINVKCKIGGGDLLKANVLVGCNSFCGCDAAPAPCLIVGSDAPRTPRIRDGYAFIKASTLLSTALHFSKVVFRRDAQRPAANDGARKAISVSLAAQLDACLVGATSNKASSAHVISPISSFIY